MQSGMNNGNQCPVGPPSMLHPQSCNNVNNPNKHCHSGNGWRTLCTLLHTLVSFGTHPSQPDLSSTLVAAITHCEGETATVEPNTGKCEYNEILLGL